VLSAAGYEKRIGGSLLALLGIEFTVKDSLYHGRSERLLSSEEVAERGIPASRQFFNSQ